MKIKLTESKLKKIVNESIKNVLKEYSFDWDRAAEAYYGDNEYLAGDPGCTGTYTLFDAIYNELERKYGEKIADEFYYAFEGNQDDFNVTVTIESSKGGYIEDDKEEDKIIQLINSLPNKKLAEIINELIDELLNDITCDDLQIDYPDYDDDY